MEVGGREVSLVLEHIRRIASPFGGVPLVVPSVRATARLNREGRKKPVRHAGMRWDFCSLEFPVGAEPF